MLTSPCEHVHDTRAFPNLVNTSHYRQYVCLSNVFTKHSNYCSVCAATILFYSFFFSFILFLSFFHLEFIQHKSTQPTVHNSLSSLACPVGRPMESRLAGGRGWLSRLKVAPGRVPVGRFDERSHPWQRELTTVVELELGLVMASRLGQ